MGSAPNSRWGSGRGDLPPSFGETGVNAALHKPATGSKPCTPGAGPAKAVDGSLAGEDDKWCSDELHPFLQIDLGAPGTRVVHAKLFARGSTADFSHSWCNAGKPPA